MISDERIKLTRIGNHMVEDIAIGDAHGLSDEILVTLTSRNNYI